MRKKETDLANFRFVTKALPLMEKEDAQFVVALGMNEQNKLMVMSNSRMTDNQVYKLLIEAAKSIEKKGGIILLN